MGKVICVGNAKGGMGKSTLAVTLGVEGSRRSSSRVLIVDTDTQQTATEFMAIRPEKLPRPRIVQLQNERLVRTEIPMLAQEYDLVVIDSGGRDDRVFRTSVAVADTLLIPVRPGAFDVWGTDSTLSFTAELGVSRPNLERYVVFNFVKPRVRVTADAVTAIEEYGVKVLDTRLHDRTAWNEACGEGLSVREHQPRSKAAQEFGAMCREIGFELTPARRPTELRLVAGGQP